MVPQNNVKKLQLNCAYMSIFVVGDINLMRGAYFFGTEAHS